MVKLSVIGFLMASISIFSGMPDEVYAGHGRGSGGFGWICQHHSGRISAKTVELEEVLSPQLPILGRKLKSKKLDFGPSEDALEQVKYILDRLHTFDPFRAERYWEWAQKFFAETRLLPFQLMPPSYDLGPTVLVSRYVPNQGKCQAVQMSVMDTFFVPRYYVNNKFWSLLSSNSKAALILHEVIYRDAITRFHHEDSSRARLLNIALMSEEFANWPQGDYRIFLQQIGMYVHQN